MINLFVGGLSAFFFAGGFLARLLAASGLAIMSFVGMDLLVSAGLNAVINALGGLTGEALAILEIAGLGTALSILGSALMTRAALVALGKAAHIGVA